MVRKTRCPLANQHTERVNKTIKSFKEVLLATLKLTTLYIRSINSHFLKKEMKSKQKHPRCKKGATKN